MAGMDLKEAEAGVGSPFPPAGAPLPPAAGRGGGQYKPRALCGRNGAILVGKLRRDAALFVETRLTAVHLLEYGSRLANQQS